MDEEIDPDTDAEALDLLTVGDALAGERVDKALAQLLPSVSRARLQALIGEGRAALNGAPVLSTKTKVAAGDRLQVDLPPPVSAAPQPEAIPLTVVYEDKDLIVIDKPAGLVVHPAPGTPSGTLVNALLHHCGASLSGIGGVARPGIVHRIDKDTSGLLVVAKSDRAHQGLAAQFAEHSIERAYLALVRGRPEPRFGTVDLPIGRSRTNRKKMAVITRRRPVVKPVDEDLFDPDATPHGAREAVTHYTTRQVFEPSEDVRFSLLECRLETGRTHQIRVHLTYLGHPLIGDPLYGRAAAKLPERLDAEVFSALSTFPRQALHAKVLGFEHPVSGEQLSFESPLPEDFQGLIESLQGFSAP